MPLQHEVAHYRQWFPERGQNGHSPLPVLLRWSWTGILHAILTETFFPRSTSAPVISFLVVSLLRPARFWALITALFLEYTYGRDLRPDENKRFLQAAANAAGYWMAVLACRMGSFIWYYVQAVLFRQPISFHSSAFAASTFAIPLRLYVLPQILPAWGFRLLIGVENTFLLGAYNGIRRLWRLLRRVTQLGLLQAFGRSFYPTCQKWIRWGTKTQLVEELPEFSYKEDTLADTLYFRILKLEIRKPFTEIEATLLPVPLSCPGKYRCISYVWGNDTAKPHVIRLNNRRYYVTSNVHRILQSQTSIWRANYIWIDSVCIDQPNDKEKTHQVRMMRDIYAKAEKVVVWLGEPADAKSAMFLLTELRFLKWATHPEEWARWLDMQRSVILESNLAATKWKAFLELLNHPWFERVWVIQELASARSVDIIYGGYRISWRLFLTDLTIVHRDEMKDVFGLFQGSGVPGISTPEKDPLAPKNAVSMNEFRDLLSRGDYAPLHTVLVEFLSWKATLGVDKIFALLPLTDSTQSLKGLVDYFKPVCEILVGVSVHCIQKERDIAFLNFAGIGWGNIGRDQSHIDLPSWAVDWTVSRVPASLAYRMGGEEAVLYNAALTEPQFVELAPKFDWVSLRGIRIDSIQQIGPAGTFKSNLDMRDISGIDLMISWLENYNYFIRQWASDPYINGQSLSEAISRLLIGDRTAAARPAPESYRNHFARMLSSVRAVKTFIDDHQGEYISADITNDAISKEFVEIMEMWRAIIGSAHEAEVIFGQESFPRRVCVTKKGYLTAVPIHSEPGDIVVAIFATSVPFVLRAAEAVEYRDVGNGGGEVELSAREASVPAGRMAYRLVGECYCHGMMDREAFELGHGQETFTII
jgi:Heterokaryon incompatibility protein (HET)